MSIPITNGSGQSSVAAEAVGGLQYQQIEVLGKGGASVLSVNPDGSFNASIIGTPNVTVSSGSIIAVPTGNQSVSGAVQITGNNSSSIATVHVIDDPVASSMIALVTDTIIHGRTSAGGGSYVEVKVDPSGALVTALGSVVSFQAGTTITSVISSTPSSMLAGASIFGQLPAGTAVLGSVATLQGTNPWVISGTVTPSGNQSVSGTVDANQIGTWRTSVISSTPSSMLAGASIFGQLPAGTAVLGSVATLQGTNPWVMVGSVYGNVAGSVVAFQGGAPWANTNVGSVITTNIGSVITVLQSSSIIAINAGSVIAVPSNYSVIGVFDKSPSIVGTYAEDAAFTQNDKGVFVLGVRNDNMASVSSADLDYSQFAVGPVGENIVANAPITKWVQGTADIRGAGTTGGSVTVIAAQGASVFTYVTSYQVANLGSASVLVTFSGATSSIIGYTIAPAGGGSNVMLRNALKTNANGAFTASISGIASVLVSAQGFTARI